MNRTLQFLTTSALLTGCASKLGQIELSNWGKVHVGMTRDELINALGPPRTTSAHQNVEVMDYVEDRGVLVTRGTGIFKHYYVQLTDGKVDGYGPEDAVTRPPNAQIGQNRQRPDIDQLDSLGR